ncbi:hypothetical protein GCM10029963_33060 [Micromonospora andamanensis]|uniref:hypothetical protein n=1 Tax=Micromonospora andamanensis TaxID=1287068 RepID=UPI0019529274|nr:hypothetical protein [Micromonospora andamanensis]GIJ42038.1 hypothetical protein Vwe01_53630 [Micromonospora andamanensis]
MTTGGQIAPRQVAAAGEFPLTADKQLFAAVARAERQAGEQFAPSVVVQTLRRVLCIEHANK